MCVRNQIVICVEALAAIKCHIVCCVNIQLVVRNCHVIINELLLTSSLLLLAGLAVCCIQVFHVVNSRFRSVVFVDIA